MKNKLILTMSLILLILPEISGVNQKPFVIPELKEWTGLDGKIDVNENTKIIYPKDNDKLKEIAQIFSDDYFEMFGKRLQISDAKPQKGDIVFAVQNSNKLGDEGYRISIKNDIRVTAKEPIGIFWATRTLLQMREQSVDSELPKGEITDYPDYAMRGFMLDCGRKFIPMAFLRDYIKIMAYYKMNTFHIHLNDNGFKQFFEDDWSKTYAAFRLESETFPELTAQDGHYSKNEFIDFQKMGEKYFVEIIPEIDVPAHSLSFAHYNPEVGSEEYGMDHLDLFKPETYEMLDKLFDEYLRGDNPVFRSKKVHIGTDEYSNKKKEVVEKFRYFTDYYIRYVEKYGKQACIWGALTHADGDTPVKSDSTIMWLWHNPYAQPDDMMKQGFKLVSIPDGLLYIVPNAGYYYDYLNTESLYKNWTPAHIGKKVFDEKDHMILGGMFAVWNDHVGNGISTKDIHDRVMPAMQTLAVKMWTGKNPTVPFDSFDKQRLALSEAPGVNIAGKIGTARSLVMSKPEVVPGSSSEYTEIGYDYTVTFDLDGVQETKGTVLFSSPDAEFYLSDPVKGMMGFARDGYLNTFNYSVKDGKKVTVKVCGDNKATRFYVNGKLINNLSIRKQLYREGKDAMYYISTLVFPLQQAGDFKSKISNLKVYNYCDDIQK